MITEEKISSYIINNYNKIKIHSNDIKKNDIFLAFQGKKYHGNKFIKDSLIKGAKYCITDKKIKLSVFNNNVYFVKDILLYLKKISQRKRSLYKGKVIGITGSSGKTTLKENIYYYLNKKYKVSVAIKSYNNILGVIITMLNLDLKSKFALFELGTNNFGEIRYLTTLVRPNQIFITNIQSTHLEYFKNKKNIAKEKSNIFKCKYNPDAEILYLLNNSLAENTVFELAKKENLKKIITFGNSQSDAYIEKINKKKTYQEVFMNIHKKVIKIKTEQSEIHRIQNLLFVLSFFIINKISKTIITNHINKLIRVKGRGKEYKIKLNGYKLTFIDESYNANPDTMKQSILHLGQNVINNQLKILILGNMNELGNKSEQFHLEILNFIEKFNFYKVILCGDLFKKTLGKLNKPKNQFIYQHTSAQIIKYVNNIIHKKAIIMTKCSNSTEVNDFAKKFIKSCVGV